MNYQDNSYQAEPTSSNWIQSNQTELQEEPSGKEEFRISKVYDIQIRKEKSESKKSVLFENTMQKAACF